MIALEQREKELSDQLALKTLQAEDMKLKLSNAALEMDKLRSSIQQIHYEHAEEIEKMRKVHEEKEQSRIGEALLEVGVNKRIRSGDDRMDRDYPSSSNTFSIQKNTASINDTSNSWQVLNSSQAADDGSGRNMSSAESTHK